jgi:HlyD family secretion protein
MNEVENKDSEALSAESAVHAPDMPAPAPKAGGRKKRKWKRWVALVVVVAIVAAVVLQGFKKKTVTNQTIYTEEQAAYRSISQTVSVSGTAQPADSYTVTSLVSGEVLSDAFEEGDLVEKDALLYTIDPADASTSANSAQLAYDQAVRAKYPSATQSGVISEVLVKNGDSVNAGTALCTIVGSNDLTIDFQFQETNAAGFYVGQTATLYLSEFEGTLTGTVVSISDTYSAEGSGKMLRTVRVTAPNPGLITESCSAQAVIGDYSSYGFSTVNLADSTTVYASGTGTVQNFTKLPGDKVTAGDRLCTISSTSIDDQITSAQLNLTSSQDRLDNYTIKAPISGTVITKSVKSGDKLDMAGEAMAIIYDLSYMKLELQVDELDISQIQEGQAVSVSCDAVDATLAGYVDKVSIVGTTNNGVTTYPVTVVIEDYGDLLPGMNVDAEIIVSQEENAFSIPSQAVERGNKVLITADSPSAANALDDTAPEGYVYVSVELGISDDNYIAVTSGLQEGDTVAYLQEDHSTNLMDMMAGGMAAGDGQAPAGEMNVAPAGTAGGGPQG